MSASLDQSSNQTPGNTQKIDRTMVTTALDLPGYKIVKSLGIARGIVVRSRSALGTTAARLQTIVGGDITIFTELCEKARHDAFRRMMHDAAEGGANAIIAVRFDANELAPGITEVLAYGTAVTAEQLEV